MIYAIFVNQKTPVNCLCNFDKSCNISFNYFKFVKFNFCINSYFIRSCMVNFNQTKLAERFILLHFT